MTVGRAAGCVAAGLGSIAVLMVVSTMVFLSTPQSGTAGGGVSAAPASWSESTPDTQRAVFAAQVLAEQCPQIRPNHDQWVVGVAVIGAESGYVPTKLNDNPATGDLSYGLGQINMIGLLGEPRRARYGIASNDELYDPAVNAKAICLESGGGANWFPWSTYTNGDFWDHLVEAEAAVRVVESGGPTGQVVNPDGAGRWAGPLLAGLDGVNPEFARRLSALADATARATGGSVWIVDGWRSPADQAFLVARAGECGVMVACGCSETSGSYHCQRKAVDVGWDTQETWDFWATAASEYGVWQPMLYEDWHWEPVETQAERGTGGVGSLA